MPRWLSLAPLGAIAFFAAANPAAARVAISVDLASQTMHVDAASGSYDWPISSARDGFHTPHGTFGVQRMEAMHRSHKYHNSPMPHSLFFTGGYAIHGTYATASLGRPASHGCIRIAPGNAAALYQMVAQEGGRITIEGAPSEGAPRYAARTHRAHYAAAPRTRVRYADPDGAYGDQGPALGYATTEQSPFADWLLNPTTDQ